MREQEQIKNTSNTIHIELNSKLTLWVLKVLLYCQNSILCNKCILSILRLMRINLKKPGTDSAGEGHRGRVAGPLEVLGSSPAMTHWHPVL